MKESHTVPELCRDIEENKPEAPPVGVELL